MIYVQLPQNYQPASIRISEIAEIVCKHFKVSLHNIRGQNRMRTFARARHAIAYLALKNTDATLVEIGTFMGHRHHPTVIHSRDKVAEMLFQRHALAYDIHIIQEAIEKKRPRHKYAA
jgi:chromosomal replication initiator protein